MDELWSTIKKLLAETLSETAMETWFSDCELVALENKKIILCAGSELKKAVIERKFSDLIKNALHDLFADYYELEVLCGEAAQAYLADKDFNNNENIPRMDDYTFAKFVVGPSNELAYNAALYAAANPGKLSNPLFLYGGSGLGKTHLLCAVGHAFRERFPGLKIVYTKGDEFINELVAAIRDRTTEQLRQKFRMADLLLVDDAQFMAGKTAVQEEFFCTFNALYEAGHQIVITSDRPPNELANIEERLRTRFQSGMIAEILPPDEHTREDIIRTKADGLGLEMSEREVTLMGQALRENVRQIEGAVKSLAAYKEMMGVRYSPEYFDRVLNTSGVSKASLNAGEIIRETARYYSVSEAELRGSSRGAVVSAARRVAMYVLRTKLNMTLTEIGEEFGCRNHSTVLSALRKAQTELDKNLIPCGIIEDIANNAAGN